jgi:hypothetical protein
LQFGFSQLYSKFEIINPAILYVVMKTFKFHFLELLNDTWQTSWKVLKLIIPVSIIVKILDLLGFIEVFGQWMAPLMAAIGLPPSFGLVWATNAIANMFSGLYVFVNFIDNQTFTNAQVTVLAVMMLTAHSLPIELEVASRVGVRRWFMFLLRFFAAYMAGFLLNKILTIGNFLQQKNINHYPKSAQKVEFIWHKWALEQVQGYVFIILIIFSILLIMKLLKHFGAINYIQNKMKPILRAMGMSKEILPMTLVGMLLGIVYGGALIIKEKDDNPSIHKKEFVFAMVLLGLCHAIIEDTLLVMGIGASLWGVLVFRVIFALIFTYLFVKISNLNIMKPYLRYITK